MNKKPCPFCKKFKPSYPGNLVCKTCHNKRVAQNRRINGNYKVSKTAHRTKSRQRVADLKESQPCMDCGLFWPGAIMEFDHRPGTKKKGSVSSLVAGGYGWKTIKKEIDKCDLVCANCHRFRTHIIRKAPKG